MGLKSDSLCFNPFITIFAPYMGLKRLICNAPFFISSFAPYMGLKSMKTIEVNYLEKFAPYMGLKSDPI